MLPLKTSGMRLLVVSFLSIQAALAVPLTSGNEDSHGLSRDLHAAGWLDRRALVKDTDPANALGSKLWPDKTITYRYKDAASKSALDADLKKAWKVWKDALPKDSGFKFQEAASGKAADNVLTIAYEKPVAKGGAGTLKTSVGIPHSQAVKPTMTLSDDTTKGARNVVTNYAHEIGHAWGFLHTHQNPNYWSTDFANGKGGAIFTKANWHPENLADYDSTMKKITDAAKKVSVTKDRMEAATNRFSAMEWLPITSAEKPKTIPASQSKTDIDWLSIMLYPSDAGSKKAGLPVLTKPNGEKITANAKPSQADIQALVALYKDQKADSDDDVSSVDEIVPTV